MRQPFEARDIALKNLALHPANVRATAPGAYDEAQVALLAANNRACGLIQPLLVAPMPGATEGQGAWGVLAGGRRLAALKLQYPARRIRDLAAVVSNSRYRPPE